MIDSTAHQTCLECLEDYDMHQCFAIFARTQSGKGKNNDKVERIINNHRKRDVSKEQRQFQPAKGMTSCYSILTHLHGAGKSARKANDGCIVDVAKSS